MQYENLTVAIIRNFAHDCARGHRRVRKNVTIDWTLRENVRAQLRFIIKRILRKHGYPPDKQEKATQTVLEQVELLGWEVAA
jgi:type I restriction enzyme R subunit